MAATDNYSWPTPDDTDPIRDGAAAMRALAAAIDAGVKALADAKLDLTGGTVTGDLTMEAWLRLPTGRRVEHEVLTDGDRYVMQSWMGSDGSAWIANRYDEGNTGTQFPPMLGRIRMHPDGRVEITGDLEVSGAPVPAMVHGSYTGDGSGNRTIALPFQPVFAIISSRSSLANSTNRTVFTQPGTTSTTGVTSLGGDGSASKSSSQARNHADGLFLTGAGDMNISGRTYDYVAWG